MNIATLFPQFAAFRSPCSICLRLTEAMEKEGADISLWVPAAAPEYRAPYMRYAVPPALWPIARRIPNRDAIISRRLEQRYVQSLKNGAIAYGWPTFTDPTISPECLRAIRKKNVPIVLEFVNCHLPVRQRLINEAARQLGWPSQADASESALAAAQERLDLADYFFAPSPAVRDSLAESGIEESRILSSSYACLQEHTHGTDRALDPVDGPTFLFVGVVYFRKGVPMLLDAWRKAKVKGRLVVIGRLDRTFADYWNTAPKDDSVVQLQPTSNLAAVYRSADVLVLPSVEEGSPLVTYEAMAHGLPMIATTYGSGGVIEEGKQGYIVDPFDTDAWVQAIRTMANDEALRKKMSAAALQRAQHFTMQKVAVRRLAQLQSL
jgi:glycosyltransferase involved in cell wall biosynthesis